MIGMILLTLRELWAKKITIGVFIVVTLIWVMMSFALNLDIVDGALVGVKVMGQATDIGTTSTQTEEGSVVSQVMGLDTLVIQIEQFIAGASYWVGILLGLFASAPLFASLLEKGRIDLMISKPLSRMQIFWGHIAGILLSVFVMCVYLLGMIWIVLSLKTGVWNPYFFWALILILLMFAIMYSVVTLVVAFTQSTALALIATYGLIFCSMILLPHEQLAPQINLPWRNVYLAFYHLLPNFAEVTEPVVQLSAGKAVTKFYPILSSALFGLGAYTLAAFHFNRRDF